jgi:hypothetical protein
MKDRLSSRKLRPRAERLWTATYVLMALRYSEALASQLFREVLTMEESVTYQWIIRKGEVREARKVLLLQGRIRFGEPPAEVIAALEAIQDIPELEELGGRIVQVDSWDELLNLSGPRSRSRRRKRTP